jgi:hypothetical protein
MLVFVPPVEPQSIQPDLEIQFFSHAHLPDGFRTLSSGRWQPYPQTALPYPTDDDVWRDEDQALFGFRFQDTSEFVFSADGRHIWVSWDDSIAFEHVAAHVLNSALGFNLRLRGHACLHASSVMVDDRAVLFVGDSGMGKSTTAGFFARSGCPLLTDDFAALRSDNRQIWIDPGYPSVRLFPDSGRTLANGTADDALKPVAPNRRKHYLNLAASGYPFAESAAKLGMIYVLAGRAEEVESRPVPPMQALVELMQHLYPWAMSGTAEHQRDIKALAALAQQVPVRWLVLPNQIDKLGAVVEQARFDLEISR